MLGDAASTATAAQQRRTAVRDRVVAYNKVLADVCGAYARCRTDGGAVFGYRFTADELSTWDWFHPSRRGQEQLARVIYEAFTSSRVTG
jgi:lysophospholipase L1-like esterase